MSELVVGSVAWAHMINRRVVQEISGKMPDHLPIEDLIGEEDPQTWAQRVIKGRFEKALCMPSLGTINALRARGMITNVATEEEAYQRIASWGFEFEHFKEVLEHVGFFGDVKVQLGIDFTNDDVEWGSEKFRILLNVVNGNHPDVDYEAMVYARPRAGAFLDRIKVDFRRHDKEIVIGEVQNPSHLSTMHIIGSLVFDTLLKDATEIERRNAFELSTTALDTACLNPQRIQAYKELAAWRVGRGRLVELLDGMAKDLVLPRNHPAHYTQGMPADLFIPLHGTGLGREPYYARWLMETVLGAFLLPSGFHSPDEMKQRGAARALYSESEETIACALVRRSKHPHYFADIPDMPRLPDCPPVDVSQILMPEMQSIDTPGNAEHTKKFADALSAVLGRRIRVVLVVTSRHSARAYANFLKVFGDKVDLKVFVCPDPGHEVDAAAKVNMNPILNWIAELKRLYMVAVP